MRFLYDLWTANLVSQVLKCSQILTKMIFLYALWTANLVLKLFRMLTNIIKNVSSVCPLDSQRCFTSLQNACKY